MFLQMLNRLRADWPEQRRAVHVLAARYYIGADTREDLERQGRPLVGWSGKSPLTSAEVSAIIEARDKYLPCDCDPCQCFGQGACENWDESQNGEI